jgi:small GTP-binding protein
MVEEFRVVVLGSGGVGKSALTLKFVQGIFVTKYDPTVEDSYTTTTDYQGQTYRLEILDTAGTEQFSSMRDLYMRNGQGFVLVYSLIATSTFNEIVEMEEQVRRVKDSQPIGIVLAGNKLDMEPHRQVATEDGMNLAKKYGAAFHETSAKTGTNVSNVFLSLLDQMINIKQEGERKKKETQTVKKRNGCVIV